MKSRVILHIDMNAFFASVEERCNPALRGKPIAVIGSSKRTVVTTASYEARKYGVKTGMNRYEAMRLCPRLIFVIGDNTKYVDASLRILEILKGFSPRVEAYSIDEAFVDMTGTALLFGPAEGIALEIKRRIMGDTGLTASIGIAPNKLLAKLASDMQKPDGLVVIGEGDVRGVLEGLPVEELWGIGPRLTCHLAAMGIRTCGELGRAPASALRRRFGVIGERLKAMGEGVDESPVIPIGEEAEAKSVGHSMTLPTDVSESDELKRHILKLSGMVGARARRYGLKGGKVSLTLRYPDFYTFSRQKSVPAPTNDTGRICDYASAILSSLKLRDAVRLVGVAISGLVKEERQMPLFDEERRREALLKAVDAVNSRFGDFTLTWGTLLQEEDGPGVISPSWRPEGVKRVEFS